MAKMEQRLMVMAIAPKRALSYLRSLAAANSKQCPADILTMLSDSDQSYVRLLVAKNSNCPVETLAKLANDPDDEYEIPQAVANRRQVTVNRSSAIGISSFSAITFDRA